MAQTPHVVIVGGGFGGLNAAQALRRAPVRVTLIDRKNHHNFQPLLYQVASAALSPADIAVPIRAILRHNRNTVVVLSEVVGFDLDARKVRLDDGAELAFDYLIVAAGARHSYFGHDAWEPLAPGLKTLEDAVEIRRRILFAYELAEKRAAEGRPPAPLSFVVIGAGPTGVELAGALVEIARHTLSRDFRHIDPGTARVVLLEGGPRVLPAYPPDLSRSAEEQLRRLGVEVRLNAMVTVVEPGLVRAGEEEIPAAVTLWAAGVAASPLGRLLAPTDAGGRVPVEKDCSLPSHPNVFVIGDMASLHDAGGNLLPGVAPVAIQQGIAVAQNILGDLRGRPRRAFLYRDKGTLATIGRAAAVAQIGKLKFSGLPAWLVWVFVHLLWLIGFRNKLVVMIEWMWFYLSYQRGPRLITGDIDQWLGQRTPQDERRTASSL